MNTVPKEWLIEKVSVLQAESTNMEGDRPFGYLGRKWERLKGRMAVSDELWEFSSPPESWAHRKGRQGYAVVRDGEIVECLVTTEN